MLKRKWCVPLSFFILKELSEDSVKTTVVIRCVILSFRLFIYTK